MNEAPRVFLSQIQLVCAILSELSRQNPGVLITSTAMNSIIQSADEIVAAARQGLSLPKARPGLEGPINDR